LPFDQQHRVLVGKVLFQHCPDCMAVGMVEAMLSLPYFNVYTGDDDRPSLFQLILQQRPLDFVSRSSGGDPSQSDWAFLCDAVYPPQEERQPITLPDLIRRLCDQPTLLWQQQTPDETLYCSQQQQQQSGVDVHTDPTKTLLLRLFYMALCRLYAHLLFDCTLDPLLLLFGAARISGVVLLNEVLDLVGCDRSNCARTIKNELLKARERKWAAVLDTVTHPRRSNTHLLWITKDQMQDWFSVCRLSSRHKQRLESAWTHVFAAP
jgi:hypothetical protein